jgi:hypothetical protein
MTDIDKIAARRRALRTRFGTAYDRLAVILFEEDPIGINFRTNTDEYEPEVDTIIPRLATCRTVIEIRDLVHEEFLRWFDGVDVGEADRYHHIAERIGTSWLTCSGPDSVKFGSAKFRCQEMPAQTAASSVRSASTQMTFSGMNRGRRSVPVACTTCSSARWALYSARRLGMPSVRLLKEQAPVQWTRKF